MSKPSWKQHVLSSVPGGENVTIRIVGWIIWAISILFGWLPIYHFKKYGHIQKGKGYVHTEQLVNKGIYSIVRHPQYFSLPLFNIGLMLISQRWIIIVLGTPAILLMIPDLIIADKEGLEKFGDAYREYAQQVPKLNFILGIFRLLKRKFKQKK
jgi:protein-S-isoprenylcysteine O-methyltransferase Ste14